VGESAPGPELLFYDGACGLCHRSVRFVAAADRSGLFRFAPLAGETFRAAVGPERRAGLPDSIVVRRADDGALLVRSDAVLHVLHRLGGGWRALAALLRLAPRPLRDAAYDFVARRRARWFAPPADACPVVPPHLRARFAP
jgi:predicted DCC family thiol-disulfide oxidoreductase YuxK